MMPHPERAIEDAQGGADGGGAFPRAQRMMASA